MALSSHAIQDGAGDLVCLPVHSQSPEQAQSPGGAPWATCRLAPVLDIAQLTIRHLSHQLSGDTLPPASTGSKYEVPFSRQGLLAVTNS